MTMKITNVSLSGGVQLSVEEAGEGPALLLLHAGVSERHMWDRQWEWLKHTMRVVRWDWRGLGETPQVPGPFSYVDDVIRVMDDLNIPTATVMGCSMGGSTAIQMAIQHPERVTRLVLVGPGIPGYHFDNPSAVNALFSEADEAFASGNADEALILMEKLWLIGPNRTAPDVDAQYLKRARELLHQSDQPDNGAHNVDDEWSAVGRLSEVTVPVLIIVGDQDVPSIVSGASFLQENLARVQLAVIENAAHLPNLEKPRQFDAVLSDWLGETAPVSQD